MSENKLQNVYPTTFQIVIVNEPSLKTPIKKQKLSDWMGKHDLTLFSTRIPFSQGKCKCTNN